MRSKVLAVGLVALFPGFGCESRSCAVVVYTSVDDVFAKPIFEAFERETGVRIEAVFDAEATKVTGLYQRLLAERSRPRADLFWSSEPSRTLSLEAAGALEPYVSPNAVDIPAEFKSLSGAWTGFAARARVIVYNRQRLPDAERPRSIFDLTLERFRNEAAISDPLFGTMATHTGALWSRLGKEAVEAYFKGLVANGVKVLSGNSVVRDRVASGELLCGLTDTDDAHVAILQGLPVGVVFPDQEALFPGVAEPLGCFVFPNTVALIRGGPHPELARRLADHLLDRKTELRLAMGESAQIPVRSGVPHPAGLALPAGLVRMKIKWPEVSRGVEESLEPLRKLVVK